MVIDEIPPQRGIAKVLSTKNHQPDTRGTMISVRRKSNLWRTTLQCKLERGERIILSLTSPRFFQYMPHAQRRERSREVKVGVTTSLSKAPRVHPLCHQILGGEMHKELLHGLLCGTLWTCCTSMFCFETGNPEAVPSDLQFPKQTYSAIHRRIDIAFRPF